MTPRQPKTARATGKLLRHVPTSRDRAGGEDPRGRLRWLLDLVATDLSALPPGALWDKVDEFYAFVDLPPLQWSGLPADVEYGPRHPQVLQLWEAQTQLRSVLDYLRDPQRPPFAGAPKANFPVGGVNFLTVTRTPAGPDFSFETLDAATEALTELAFLVKAVGRSRLRFCARCKRAFVAWKRQAYCSPACSSLLRAARYRAKQAERINQRRKAAYKRKKLGERPTGDGLAEKRRG